MNRRFAVALTLMTACSSPDREVGTKAPSPAPSPAVSVASNNPTPSNPPAPAASTPGTNDELTPAETPVTPEPVATAQTPETKTPPAEPAPDPVKWMHDQEAKRLEYERSLDQLRADRDAAEARVAQSQRDLLAFRNPYLARPKLSPGDAAEVQGLNGVERVKWAEAKVADAIESLESAKKAYEDAKANPPAD